MKRKDKEGRILQKGESIRKDGRYCFCYTDYTGNRKMEYANTLDELRKKENEINKNLMMGISNDKSSIEELVWNWICLKNNLKDSSLNCYTNYYNAAIKNTKFSKLSICEVKSSHVLQFIQYLKNVKNYEPTTIKLIVVILQQAFQFAVNDNLIMKNPVSNIEILIKPKEKEPLNKKQSNSLIEIIKNDKNSFHLYPLTAIILATGLRISEAAGLTWDDVNLDDRYISIKKQLLNINKSLKLVSLKSKSSERIIPINEQTKELLLIQKELFPNKCLKSVDGFDNFVFRNKKNSVISVRSYEMLLKRISESKDLPKITPHILRHTACTNMIQDGLNIKVVQKIMGHKTPDVTLDVYTHVSNEYITQEFCKIYDNFSECKSLHAV